MRARNDVLCRGLTCAQAARKYGVNRTTIWRWIQRAEQLRLKWQLIYLDPSFPTPSSPTAASTDNH